MATPKGTRAQCIATKSGEAVHIYTPAEALSVAGESLTVAGLKIKPKA
jgi:hypothetical protein